MSDKIRKYIRKILAETELESNNLNDNFNKWFSGSKVVDASGNPMIVYHGTSKKFSKFSFKNAIQPIIWFTSDKSTFKDDASGASGAAGKGYVMELYANIKNPAYWEEYSKYGLGQLIGMGYDGVILPEGNTFDGFVFEPNQLKSVKNKGEWDSNNKNIFKEENSNENDKVIFLRNVNYSNKGNVRKLPYEGIHCWAVKEFDLDKFFEQAYYQGSDKKDFVEIKPEGKKIYALNFKVADDYVKGNSDLKPEIEKFNPNKHTLKFKKVSGKSMYSYHSDLDYQILMNPERIN